MWGQQYGSWQRQKTSCRCLEKRGRCCRLDNPGLDTILSKLLTSSHDINSTVVDLRITGSRLSSPLNCECIQKGMENQYEDKNVILMIVNFKDSDPALATHDFDVIG